MRAPRRVWVFALLALAPASCAREAQPTADEARQLARFPPGYEESRARLRLACRRLASGPADFCGRFDLPGPGEPDLTIDHAFFAGGADRRGGDRLLVVQSGLHGVEAPAGAAVQDLLLDEHLQRFLARGVDVLVVHALDPYGFRRGRRTDEANVNLNRNFDRDGRLYRTENPGYDRLRPLLEPEGPVGSPALGALRSGLGLAGAAVGQGGRAVSQALNAGQYRHPRGLNYGGQGPAAQGGYLRGLLAPLLARPYRRVLLLDVHTGLGEAGVLSLIEGVAPPEAGMRELRALLGGQEAQGIVFRSGQSPGFYPTSGDVIDWVPTLAPDPDRVLAVTMEYGTLGTDALSELRSAARLVLENQAHHHGCTSPPVCREVKEHFAELFNPGDPAWRLKVLRAADAVFSRLAEGF